MNGVSTFLTRLAHQSFFLFAIAIMVIVLGITYIGVHQLIILSLMGILIISFMV